MDISPDTTKDAAASPLTENAKALVAFLSEQKLTGQSIWLRDISRRLELPEEHVVQAITCLGWDAKDKKWLTGGQGKACLDIRDPLEVERLAASIKGSAVPAPTRTRGRNRVKKKTAKS